MAGITDDQVAQLLAAAQQLATDHADANTKTQASNTADTVAAQATAAAAQAKLDEAAADAKTSADVTNMLNLLQSFSGGGTPTPTPTPTPTEPPTPPASTRKH